MKTVALMTLLAALTLSAADIRIKTTEKEFQRKENKLRSKEQVCQLDGSSIVYRYVTNAEGKIVIGGWDDFFFGLRHGSVNNGSWSPWNFFQVFNAQNKNVLNQSPAEKVSLVQFDGGTMLDFKWKDLSS